ncbi:hypothetical protein [Streptomyces sp. NPDC008125]|uniref:hypothetical protein n=1 Tax=Streptomyces sp. NPDC008125 TaxID=3364811 RepID=UPI0036ED227D
MPPPAQVVGTATTPGGTGGPSRRLRCELAEHHRAEHAELLWEDDRLGGALWVRWTDTRMYRVVLFWCTATDELGDACGLFDDHPAAHSWRIVESGEDGPPELPLQRGEPDDGGSPPTPAG